MKKFFLSAAMIAAISTSALAGSHGNTTAVGGSALATVGVNNNGSTISSLSINNNGWGGAGIGSGTKGNVTGVGGDAGAGVNITNKHGGNLPAVGINNNASGGFGGATSGWIW